MKKPSFDFIRIVFLIFIFGSSLLVWMRFIEPNLIQIKNIPLSLGNYPGQLKILHLSDFQTIEIRGKEKRLLGILDELEYDFIVITGDIVDWETKDLESVSWLWQEISKNRNVFVVSGNHEHRNLKFKKIIRLFNEKGFIVLENESKEINVNGFPFYLIGVDDPHLGYDDPELAMKNVPDDSFKVMLAHSPEIFRNVKKYNLDLILTGHTHGCQVNVPLICDYILPMRYDKQYKQGLFYEDNTFLYVTRGFGETFLPFRLNARPEITVIEIN